MDLNSILYPDWKKINQIRERSSLSEILSKMQSDEFDIEAYAWTSEDLAMFVIRSHAGFKWRLSEAIHKCGRFQACQIFWSLANKADDSEAIELNAENFQSATIKDHATFFMNRIDKEICENLHDLAESLLTHHMLISRCVNAFKDHASLSEKDLDLLWESLDWPSLFHAVGTPWNSDVLHLFMSPADNNAMKDKFDELVEISKLAVNKGNAITPDIRSTIEQALARSLDSLEPFGLEEGRITNEPTAWGFCV